MAAETERSEWFLSAFLTCWEIHKDKEPTELILTAYQRALDSYTIEQIEAAFLQAMVALRWFPKPVELIEIITGGGAQNLEDHAHIEAHKVLDSVRRIGGYSSVKFDDPVTMAVIKQGFDGWPNLCNDLTEDQVKWFLKDFVRIYQAYRRQDIKYDGYLPGRTEIQNSANGYDEFDKPVLIGGNEEFRQLPN